MVHPCLLIFYLFIFCSFIHMCIHCLGHFSTLPPIPTLPHLPSSVSGRSRDRSHLNLPSLKQLFKNVLFKVVFSIVVFMIPKKIQVVSHTCVHTHTVQRGCLHYNDNTLGFAVMQTWIVGNLQQLSVPFFILKTESNTTGFTDLSCRLHKVTWLHVASITSRICICCFLCVSF
jgi:hypothetical protein